MINRITDLIGKARSVVNIHANRKDFSLWRKPHYTISPTCTMAVPSNNGCHLGTMVVTSWRGIIIAINKVFAFEHVTLQVLMLSIDPSVNNRDRYAFTLRNFPNGFGLERTQCPLVASGLVRRGGRSRCEDQRTSYSYST